MAVGDGPARAHKVVVLGLVTTKTPRVETVNFLKARLADTTRYGPWERLALSPPCGFATSVIGNAISPDDEARKLRTIAETAQDV